MKKLIKYSLIVGGILLALVLVVIIATPYLLNVDTLREWGEKQASNYVGRQVTIEDAGFSWAGPKVRLSGFSIAGKDGKETEPFARFQSLDLKLRLVDLLRLRLSVEHVILSGPVIRIVRDAKGQFNFQDILDHLNKPAVVAELPYAAMEPGASNIKAPPVDLLVEEIRMESGEIFFADETNPRLAKGVTLEGINLTLKDLSLDRPVTITAALGIGNPSEDIHFEGLVGPVGKVIIPEKIPFDLKLDIKPFELIRLPRIIGPLPVGLSGVFQARETVRGSLAEGINYQMEGSLEKLNVNGSDNKPLVTDFTGTLTQSGQVDLGSKVLKLDAFTLEAYQAVFKAEGSVRNLGASPLLDLNVHSNPIPLAGWDKVLPDLGPMLKLDGDLTFEGRVTGTVGRDLKANLAFKSHRFEMDRGPGLLDRSSSEAAAVPGKPLEPVKAPPISVTGEVTVEEGRFEKISFSNLAAHLSQRESLISLDDLKMEAFSGRLSGMAWADLGALPLAYGTRMVMTGVEINEALAAVAGMDGIVYGKASMDVALKGQGTQFSDLEKNLSGKGAVKAEEGRLTTANLGGGAAKAASLLGIGDSSGETRFENMNVSFTIEDGKVKVSNMRIATGEYALRAQGDIGLDRSLDMTSRMTLSQEATARIPENRRALFPKEADGRLQIPLKIGGTVTSPKIGLDSSAMKEAAKEEVKKEVEKKLQKSLGDKLKKLF